MKTKDRVIFYMEKFDHNSDETVMAYFPDIVSSEHGRMKYKTAYSHIGQHSGCAPSYVRRLKRATPDQYKDLAAELTQIGYNLKILNR